jgi:hypothetical protein
MKCEYGNCRKKASWKIVDVEHEGVIAPVSYLCDTHAKMFKLKGVKMRRLG